MSQALTQIKMAATALLLLVEQIYFMKTSGHQAGCHAAHIPHHAFRTGHCRRHFTITLVCVSGVGAAVVQLGRGTKYKRFPGWLDRWLCRRKELGLLSFLCALLHAVYSMCLTLRRAAGYATLNAAYRQVSSGQVNAAWAHCTPPPPAPTALWIVAFR